MAINLATRHLRAFLAVAELRNFTKAAALLNISQPSLSATIRQLEEMLGARMFERHAKQVRLTGIGETYLGVAQRLLSEFDASVDVVRDLVEKRKGHLHIATLPSVAAGFLAEELRVFRQRFPNIGLSLHDDFNKTLMELVRRGDVDLGFVHMSGDVDYLDSELLFEERYVLICAVSHPLAGNSPLRWADIMDYPFINVAKGSSTQDVVQQAFAENGYVMKNKIDTNYVSTAIGMVAAGLGVTALPGHAFENLAGRKDLITRPLVGPDIAQRVHLVTRKNQWLSPAAEAFREQILSRPSNPADGGSTQCPTNL